MRQLGARISMFVISGKNGERTAAKLALYVPLTSHPSFQGVKDRPPCTGGNTGQRLAVQAGGTISPNRASYDNASLAGSSKVHVPNVRSPDVPRARPAGASLVNCSRIGN